MKLKQIIEARNAIPTQDTSASLQTKYKLAKFISDTNKDYAYYVEEFNKILADTADRQENGFIDKSGLIHVRPEKVDEYRSRVEELDNVEVDTPNVAFTFAELEPIALSIDAVGKLCFFIKEEE